MMAHYAFLDDNNVVTEVITGVDENITQIDIDGTEVGGSTEAWEEFYGNLKGKTCKRTSYNTIFGKRRGSDGQLTDDPGFRKNFATVGCVYSESLDSFIYARPTEHGDLFQLDEETGTWEPINPEIRIDPEAPINPEEQTNL
jgi:hypothetical protein